MINRDGKTYAQMEKEHEEKDYLRGHKIVNLQSRSRVGNKAN